MVANDLATAPAPDEALEPPVKKSRWWRILVLLGLVGLIAWGTHAAGLTEDLTVEKLRTTVEAAGAWSYVVYVVAFVTLELVQLPAWILIGAGSLAYGHFVGFIVAFIASMASVTVTFGLVRWAGGQPLGRIKYRWVRKMLEKLERYPIAVIIVIRTVLWVSPPINYVLALSPIRFRDYILGSAIGLVLPVFVLSFFFNWVAQYLG